MVTCGRRESVANPDSFLSGFPVKYPSKKTRSSRFGSAGERQGKRMRLFIVGRAAFQSFKALLHAPLLRQ